MPRKNPFLESHQDIKKITLYTANGTRSYLRYLAGGKIFKTKDEAMRHTNLTNEITGSYHNSKFDWSVVIAMGVMIAVTGVIYWLAF